MSDTNLTTPPAPPSGLFSVLDGEFLTIANADLGNADTSYSYFDLSHDFNHRGNE